MEEKEKFKLKVYLKYLILSPWKESVSIPNFSTITWVLIIISLLLKSKALLFVSVCLGVIFYLIKEYKSGIAMHWYRMRSYKEQKEALKKVRAQRKNGHKINN